MQHVTDPAALLEEQAEGSGEDNDDKEISYLRKRVQGMAFPFNMTCSVQVNELIMID